MGPKLDHPADANTDEQPHQDEPSSPPTQGTPPRFVFGFAGPLNNSPVNRVPGAERTNEATALMVSAATGK